MNKLDKLDIGAIENILLKKAALALSFRFPVHMHDSIRSAMCSVMSEALSEWNREEWLECHPSANAGKEDLDGK